MLAERGFFKDKSEYQIVWKIVCRPKVTRIKMCADCIESKLVDS
jgi:hypothetical protein